ncbi:hypothetical protein GCM10011395_12840 [Sphingomonas psychrolutea]|uniref:Uncharacterized protein n=1 Tax=Sphingomonas psychrolutea TaxID=1259676 RepID=A0ABQ1GHP9_9SPHN|nr:hypothetical protein GCM10011395_12840 [Sphingomonas psychrolutea]
MSRSDWGIVATVVGCLALASLALADSQYEHEKRIAAKACATEHPCQRQQVQFERAGLPSFAERFVSNPDPNNTEEKERRDLAAQEASAVWAFYAVLIAGLSAIVTAIGTVLLYQQIVLTRRAVEDTGLATDAMKKSNDIAMIGQRPWISIEGIKITKCAIDGGMINFEFEYTLINSGNSPAIDATCGAGFHELYTEIDYTAHAEAAARRIPAEGGGEGTIGPHGENTISGKWYAYVNMYPAHEMGTYFNLVLACGYASPLTGERHHTIRVVRISDPDNRGINLREPRLMLRNLHVANHRVIMA